MKRINVSNELPKILTTASNEHTDLEPPFVLEKKEEMQLLLLGP